MAVVVAGESSRAAQNLTTEGVATSKAWTDQQLRTMPRPASEAALPAWSWDDNFKQNTARTFLEHPMKEQHAAMRASAAGLAG